MEEKIIIKSVQYNIKLISLIIVGIGVVLFILLGLPLAIDISNRRDGLDLSYFLTSAFPYYACFTLLPFLILAGLFYWYCSRISITVSDKRVFGTAVFGQRVDLPFDMISAVKTTRLWRGIAVATASGFIRFVWIKNAAEIHTEINRLLLERQDKRAASAARQEAAPQSNATAGAEELKRYKELLDSGVITQEEFDAKKKQILGL